jgi:hypothetical protein
MTPKWYRVILKGIKLYDSFRKESRTLRYESIEDVIDLLSPYSSKLGDYLMRQKDDLVVLRIGVKEGMLHQLKRMLLS